MMEAIMNKVSAKSSTVSGKVAAIDVGSERMHVAVHEGPVQVFDTMTDSLCALRDFLKAQGVVAVAMEATGVYWLGMSSSLALQPKQAVSRNCCDGQEEDQAIVENHRQRRHCLEQTRQLADFYGAFSHMLGINICLKSMFCGKFALEGCEGGY
jgi:hypothetical protein